MSGVSRACEGCVLCGSMVGGAWDAAVNARRPRAAVACGKWSGATEGSWSGVQWLVVEGRARERGLRVVLGMSNGSRGERESGRGWLELGRPVGWSPAQVRQDGMATVATPSGMATITVAIWVFPACNLGVGQVRGMERSNVAQGIEEPSTESTDLSSGLRIWGRTGVVHATCSTKCLNRI